MLLFNERSFTSVIMHFYC